MSQASEKYPSVTLYGDVYIGARAVIGAGADIEI